MPHRLPPAPGCSPAPPPQRAVPADPLWGARVRPSPPPEVGTKAYLRHTSTLVAHMERLVHSGNENFLRFRFEFLTSFCKFEVLFTPVKILFDPQCHVATCSADNTPMWWWLCQFVVRWVLACLGLIIGWIVFLFLKGKRSAPDVPQFR